MKQMEKIPNCHLFTVLCFVVCLSMRCLNKSAITFGPLPASRYEPNCSRFKERIVMICESVAFNYLCLKKMKFSSVQITQQKLDSEKIQKKKLIRFLRKVYILS